MQPLKHVINQQTKALINTETYIQLRSANLDTQELLAFINMRFAYSDIFVKLLKVAIKKAFQQNLYSLAMTLTSNLADELGITKVNDIHTDLSHKVWRAHFLAAFPEKNKKTGFFTNNKKRTYFGFFIERQHWNYLG